ncbi:GNAT family N-acetyltransferase [Gryllotalpicola ginsengisoli]|uniref:GNAT family N-acetyltransferase n=1 Tax=Gryllotalpicola ginsengisoli TaxID=444608 RepID=UPI0003B70253|nr:GNAT family N-acetyltransferase [Gryllotalpicola ginsengisoli]
MPSDVRILALDNSLPTTSTLPGLRVRPITNADREDLAVLYRDSYPPEVGAHDLDEARTEIDMTFAGDFGKLRRDASLLALIGGDPAGAVLVVARSIWDEDLPGPFVIDLFVHPSHRGLGIGRALMVGAIAACRAHGDTTLSLRVGEGTSPAAHALYAGLGFAAPS